MNDWTHDELRDISKDVARSWTRQRKQNPPQVEIILSPDAPLDSARELIRCYYTTGTHRTLHHQQATFYSFSGPCYAALAPESVRSTVYTFLDAAKVVTVKGSL